MLSTKTFKEYEPHFNKAFKKLGVPSREVTSLTERFFVDAKFKTEKNEFLKLISKYRTPTDIESVVTRTVEKLKLNPKLFSKD